VSFGGASLIRRRFKNPQQSVTSIETRFGFSVMYSKDKHILWTLYLPGQSYVLLFAVDQQGHLIINEKHGEQGIEATISYQHFADGSRHAVYFKRDLEETLLIVDQQEIQVDRLTGGRSLIFMESSEEHFSMPLIVPHDSQTGEVFIGGVNEAVPMFMHFKRFKGCISRMFTNLSNAS